MAVRRPPSLAKNQVYCGCRFDGADGAVVDGALGAGVVVVGVVVVAGVVLAGVVVAGALAGAGVGVAFGASGVTADATIGAYLLTVSSHSFASVGAGVSFPVNNVRNGTMRP
jgi:hypothetical protein